MTKKLAQIGLFVLLLNGCQNKKDVLLETLAPDQSGIHFQNTLTETEDNNILDYLYFYNGGGVAIGDINGDDLPDIYFSGNQVKNKLYINKGDLKFEDVTQTAGVGGNSDWNTGVAMADVNGDGLLDIYVCAVVGINGFNGHNELFINNGVSKDGQTTFSEKSAEFGLDFENYSSSVAFFDYDLDGDLDMYLLNHAIHNETSFGNANIRNNRNYESGDKLLRNDGVTFVDVSEEAGIYGGANGYGLGLAISDFNLDGYPDIYVGNDFHEDDYFYLNNGDGTFKESLKDYFGHTSRFSMGNDIADINHDGYPDILSLDMLPKDEKTLKSSAGDDKVAMMEMRIKRLGYHYQFSRNMLHMNNKGKSFTETALMSGVAATDWSWGALFCDYDQDGEQDLFISNGIPKRPNNLDYVNFTSNEQIRTKLNNTKLVDNKALQLMPKGNIPNSIFQGNKNLHFLEKSGEWIENDSLISNGLAYGDLDNDGDLDLVTNNLNAPATLYVNQSDTKNNYIKIKPTYRDGNKFGVGTKVSIYTNGDLQYKELYPSRGFQSSSEPLIHFGLGKSAKIDSLHIQWPDGTNQFQKEIAPNQTLAINYAGKTLPLDDFNLEPLFKKVEGNLGINYIHEENGYIDFDFQKLIPYMISDKGPATAIGDMDGDGKKDIFFGSSHRSSSSIFLQKDTIFLKAENAFMDSEKIYEDVDAIIEDFNKDGAQELFVVSGGGQFSGSPTVLQDRLYEWDSTRVISKKFVESFGNGSVVTTGDYNNDGLMDIFVGCQSEPRSYGKITPSFLFKNDGVGFEKISSEILSNLGMVTDATFSDFDMDGLLDLVVVGEWMPPTFLKNSGSGFINVTKDVSEAGLNGLWQSLVSYDIDDDGDQDYLLGNWGENSKFSASIDYPMKMHYADFDQNGLTETIVSIEKNGSYYPIADLDALSSQMVSLGKKKFPSYGEFAGKSLEEIFDKNILNKAKRFTVATLSSGFLRNDNGKFKFVRFPSELQIAPIMAFLEADFDNDGKKEVLTAGNYFGVIPYHGRYDGFTGALIKSENSILLGYDLGLNFSQKSIRHLNLIELNNKNYLLVTVNNDSVEVYEF